MKYYSINIYYRPRSRRISKRSAYLTFDKEGVLVGFQHDLPAVLADFGESTRDVGIPMVSFEVTASMYQDMLKWAQDLGVVDDRYQGAHWP